MHTEEIHAQETLRGHVRRTPCWWVGGGGHKEDQSHAVSAEKELWSLPVSAMSRGSHLCHDSCYLSYILSSYGVKAICMDVTSKTTQWAHSGWLLSSERVCSLEDCHIQILSASASWLTGAHRAIERTRSFKWMQVKLHPYICFSYFGRTVEMVLSVRICHFRLDPTQIKWWFYGYGTQLHFYMWQFVAVLHLLYGLCICMYLDQLEDFAAA